MNMVTTFARLSECENARHVLDSHGIAYEAIEAAPQYARVGTAALRTSAEGQAALAMDPVSAIRVGWISVRRRNRFPKARRTSSRRMSSGMRPSWCWRPVSRICRAFA